MKDLQDYDISVHLTMPRCPANIDLGNFMVVMYLLDHADTTPATESSPAKKQPDPLTQPYSPANPPPEPLRLVANRQILFTSSRPALIPYTDPLVSLASRLLFMPYHIMFPDAERVHLVIPMAEHISFSASPAGRPRSGGPAPVRFPSSVYVDLRAGGNGPETAALAPLQVYDASVTLTARLAGLRWFMLQHRYLSFATLTTAFWICEVVAALVAWTVLARVAGPRRPDDLSLSALESLTPPPDDSAEGSEEGDVWTRKVKNKYKGKATAPRGRRRRRGRVGLRFQTSPKAAKFDDDESDVASGSSVSVSDDHVWDVKKEEESEGGGDGDDDKGLAGIAGLAELPLMTPAIGHWADDGAEPDLGIGTSFEGGGGGQEGTRRRRSRGRD